MNVIVDSLVINYAIVGNGQRSLVLLHGWGDTSETFRNLVIGLSAHYSVVTVDLPGFGGSEPPKGAWNLDAYARFLADFFKKIAVSPYAIIGHSNGGSIAIKAIGKGYIKPQKVVLLAAAGIRGHYKARNKALRLAARTAKVLISPLPSTTKLQLRKVAYKALGSDMFVAEHLQESFRLVVSEDLSEQAELVTIPTKLIYGDQDTATPPAFADIYHRAMIDSTVLIVPNAGHFVHHDNPQLVLETIEGFLQ